MVRKWLKPRSDPKKADHLDPRKGTQWPANAVSTVVLIVDLIDIADKVLTLIAKR
jgi:hypothetical protein